MPVASSADMLLSFYDVIISGIEYRQKRFSFWVSNASLLRYFYFICYLHFLPLSLSLSSYYPGPSFFPLPIYQNSHTYFPDKRDTPHTSYRFTMQPLPDILSPISSPLHRGFTPQRDPRLRKSSFTRA